MNDIKNIENTIILEVLLNSRTTSVIVYILLKERPNEQQR